ncbi:MAG: hypothetical protein NTV23_12695 [Propionibacteriales bacterium]|nr:hypothetical protein [Propionibacteriales bacterium]
MPWSPSFEDAVPDPRLDPYRNRVAQLMDGDVVAGHVLVETDYRAEVRGGFLWWRRWASPTEFALLFTRVGAAETRTTALGPADFALFDRWSTDGYVDDTRVLDVLWLDENTSRRLHDEVFAHQH